MRCLTDTELIQLVDGSLALNLGARLDEHIDSCERCFAVVASILRGHSHVHQQHGLGLKDSNEEPVELHSAAAARAVGRRYLLLERIGRGGMGQVYRAIDRLSGQQVALKRVRRGGAASTKSARTTWLSDTRGASYAHCLEQEFRLLSTLRHPNIISVLDYGFDEQLQPFFTMELLNQARPVLPLALSLPSPLRIELLIQLLHAFAYLHRRGVLHRDIKPSNLLVVPENDGRYALKVLDFGLSTGPEGMALAELCGTLAYMAPELLRGEPPSVASDLYAVGMVAFEMLTGDSPFPADGHTSKLLFSILRETPDLSGAPPELRTVLTRTLSKRPAERPRDAASLLRELCAAVGRDHLEEPPAVRDSFLLAARFVGREAELATLTQALREAQAGLGAAWLVGGESGAGKSRLMEELRSLALPKGTLVLRGQAVKSSGIAYHLWHDALRLLSFHVELEAHEIVLLSALVPNLPLLLERAELAVPTTQADLSSQSARLLRVLISVIERAEAPTLVLLEDLQWADAESLQLLRRLSERLAERPMLIVASYREEEAPRLPEGLPLAQKLRLPRLDRIAMHRLCESILGSAVQDKRLLDRVAKETEGNTYFLVEWVRALAAAAGSTDQIEESLARGLPEGIMPGVAEVLTRRLMSVPAAAQPLLQLAAVAGRQLDLPLLRRTLPQLDALIHAAAEAGMLEACGADWRFSHDKLRERILAELDPPGRRALHLRVAQGLEAVYGDADAHAATIAYHYHEAEELPRAASYSVRAGELALLRGAPCEAEAQFERATAIHKQIRPTRLAQVLAWSGLSQSRYALGKLQETFDALQAMSATADAPLPEGGFDLLLNLGEQLRSFIWGRASAGLFGRRPALNEEARQYFDALRRGMLIEEVFIWMARPGLYLLCLLRGLNLDEALEIPLAERHSLIGLPLLMSFTPLRGLVTSWLRRRDAQELANELTGLPAVSFQRTMALLWLNEGEGEAAVRCARQAVAAARALQDEHMLLLSLFQLQLAIGGLGDFAEVLAISQEMERLASRVQNPRYLAIALMGSGLALMRFGEFDRAAPVLKSARASISQEFGLMPQSSTLALSSLCALRRGHSAEALALAEEAMNTLELIPWKLLPMRHALTSVLEVYLSLANAWQHAAKTKRALAWLEEMALNFPYARPNAFLYRGRYEWWRKNSLRAECFLRFSLRAAETLRVEYEQAQAHEWLGYLAESESRSFLLPNRMNAHRAAALSLYKRSGARWDAARLLRYIPGRSPRGASPSPYTE